MLPGVPVENGLSGGRVVGSPGPGALTGGGVSTGMTLYSKSFTQSSGGQLKSMYRVGLDPFMPACVATNNVARLARENTMVLILDKILPQLYNKANRTNKSNTKVQCKVSDHRQNASIFQLLSVRTITERHRTNIEKRFWLSSAKIDTVFRELPHFATFAPTTYHFVL